MAKAEGYAQVLWLDAKEHKYVEEGGAMNIFFVMENKLVTPKRDGSILDGVTRKSILQLARDSGIEIEERIVSIQENFRWYSTPKNIRNFHHWNCCSYNTG